MASPVADSYTVASGTIYAGMDALIPAWLQNMTVGTWEHINPASTINSLDPNDDASINPDYPLDAPWHGSVGLEGIITSWCGGIWDESAKRLLVAGGGHADYAGNEVYAWYAGTGAYSRLTDPTGAIGNTGTLDDNQEATGKYFDGQPRSAHSYNNFAIRNGVVWYFGGYQYTDGFNSSCRPFFFNETAWGLDADIATGTNYGGVCWDSMRDRFWISHSGTQPLRYYDPGGTTGTATYWNNGTWTYSKLFYRPDDDLILIVQDTSTTLRLFDPADTANATIVNTTGTGPSGNLGDQGVAYDQDNDRYLFWTGGTTIYTLSPPASNVLTGTWTWGTLTIDGSNAVTPSSPQTWGTYGRFWYSKGLQCCGVVNNITEGMYIFKVA